MNNFAVQEFSESGEPHTDRVIIPAPSPGTAIEYFLATHGMTHYEVIFCGKTDEEPTEELDEVLELLSIRLPLDEVGEERCKMLDSWHEWNEWDTAEE